MLNAIASWLESPNNEALLLAEYDDQCLKVVADSCVEAAAALKKAAQTVDEIEPLEESNITSESIEELANLASVFDASGDPGLKKQASVIDELLLTIAANPNILSEKRAAEDKKIDEIKKKYEQPRKTLSETNKISESEKAISKSNMTKDPGILMGGLSTRTCIDHPGSQLSRVGEHIWQCELDHKIYNYDIGFELNDGTKIPGGDVALQTSNTINEPSHAIFDTREGRLGQNTV